MKQLLFILLISIFSFSAQAIGSVNSNNLMKGVEYKEVNAKINSEYKKSVIELFLYHCPHCYDFQPMLKTWLNNKPDYVHFEAVPAVFNSPNGVFMARVFYTAKLLGILDKSHSAYFSALHSEKQKLYDIESVAKFHAQFGTTEEDFKNMFNSFMVENKVRRAMEITRASGISGVPAIVINGKYRTDTAMAGGGTEVWKVVDALIHK